MILTFNSTDLIFDMDMIVLNENAIAVNKKYEMELAKKYKL